MKNISLYQDNHSILTKIHPMTKLLYIIVMVSLPWIVNRIEFFAVGIVCSTLLLLSGKILKKVFPLVAFSFTIVLTVFLIHGLFHHGNQTVLWQAGPVIFYQEGVLYALKVGGNIWNMLFAFAVFVLSTKPSDFVDSLEKIGLPPQFGYLIISVFQIVPQMIGSMKTILDAQKSRGMETEGSLSKRARSFFPLIAPVVSTSLITTRERAIALEIRGFGVRGKKTYLSENPLKTGDWLLIVLLLLLLCAGIVWRVIS